MHPKTAETIERRNDIIAFLMKHPDKSYSKNEICDIFSIKEHTAYRDMVAICDMDEHIKRDGTVSIMYKSPVLVGVMKPNRYGMNKNNEGYSDPTAASVLKKEDASEKKAVMKNIPKNPKVGEVWDITISSSNKTEKVIVLAVDEDTKLATCCNYFAKDEDIASCKKLYSKPIKYFVSKSWGMPLSQMTAIRKVIGEHLGIEESDSDKIYTQEELDKKVSDAIKNQPKGYSEAEVQDLIEVAIKEHDALKETRYNKPDAIYSQMDVDILVDAALSKQKAEIYEECFKLLIKRGA